MGKRQSNHIIYFILTFLLLVMNVQVFAGTLHHVTKVNLIKTTDVLTVGKTDILKATIAPTNATNKAVKWISSNAAIAKVDAAGKVTALKVGTVTITAITIDKALKSTCKVTIKPVVISKSIYVTKSGKKYHLATCSSLNKSKISITLKDAKARGFKPCSVCKPPQ